MNLSQEEKQIIVTLKQISQDDKRADVQTIELFTNYYFGNELLDWKNSFQSLIEKKIVKKFQDTHFLTKEGDLLAFQIIATRKFSNILLACEKSPTYKTFCERVYGKYLCQFNMMDIEQLDKFIEILNLSSKNSVLEIGCGNGIITEYIYDLTKATVIGIDFASGIIKHAQQRTSSKKNRLKFQEGNMDDLSFDDETFDTIIAIDSLYFAADLGKTIAKLMKMLKPNGQLGLFYTQTAQSDAAKEMLKPNKTKLAEALNKNNLNYKYWDFSNSEKNVWRKVKEVGNDLRDAFELEGNYKIYNFRLKEADEMLTFVKNNRISRYLYYVKK